MRLLVIGCGHMGNAIVTGWLARRDGRGGHGGHEEHGCGDAAAGEDRENIRVVEPQGGIRRALTDRGILNFSTLAEATGSGFLPDIILLTVKPQEMSRALLTVDDFEAAIPERPCRLSIAAGRTLASFAATRAGIRAMPNMAALAGRSVTVMTANEKASREQRALAEQLFAALGAVVWLEEEELMDAATAVSGCGPAYVFHLTECLAEAARGVGLPKETAAFLARHTVLGAAAMLEAEQRSPEDLRRAVTSPGGATEAALKVLAGDGDVSLAALLRDAVHAALRAARNLARS